LERLETRLAPANVPVLKAHYDNLISGANTQEENLTLANVNSTNFGRLFNYPTDGYIYAQPLYVPKDMYDGVHNVVFAATEHDSVYAFDADGGGQLWKRSFIDPANGVTSVPQPDVISGDIVPEVGITGTPVIDPATKTMYVVPKTKEIVGTTPHYVQRLHAIDITTGATTAVIIMGDTVNQNDNTSNIFVGGGGDGSVNGVLTFNARKESQRPALNLVNGFVYVGFASHGDNGPYHGWVVEYNASNIGAGPTHIFNTSPNGSASGIWMSGGGIAADAQNNLYFATGNGFGTGFAPSGSNLVGGGGGALGYQGLAPSVAVKFDFWKPSGDHSSTGLYFNGVEPNNTPAPPSVFRDLAGTPINFNGNAQGATPHTYQVQLTYDGTNLTETITDQNLPMPNSFSTTYNNVNLPATMGGNTAFVGFTGGTGGATSIQDVLTWTYNSSDHTGGFANSDLNANGSAAFSGTTLRLTNGGGGQAGSVFSKNQVNITNFNTTFTFQPRPGSNPIADGMTFTIQSGAGSFSESVLKLSTGGPLNVADYFTPFDWRVLDQQDADLGSGGTMLLPDAVGSAAHPHLMIETGKTGRMYLIDRDNMGKNNPNTSGPDFNVQTVTIGGPGVWGNPAFFQDGPNTGLIYYWGTSSQMKAFRITAGMIDPTPVTQTNVTIGFPGAQPSISSNGTGDAIAWALRVDNFGQSGPAELMAFNATNFQQQLFSSNKTDLTSSITDQRDRFGASVKFIFPIVSNGKVFAGSNGFLSVFGLFDDDGNPPNAAPSDFAAQPLPGGKQVTLSWTNNATNATGVKILRSTDGINFTRINTVARDATTFTDTNLTPGTNYFYNVVATNQHPPDSDPANLTVRTRIAAPVLQIADVCVGSIALKWTATANDHYTIERGDATGTTFTLIATVPASQTAFTDNNSGAGLAFGTYTYRVTAFSVFPEGNDSAASNVAKSTIGPINIDHGAPTGVPGFTDHSDLQGNGSAQFTNENLLRLNNDFGQAASAFTVQRVGIRGFSTTFQIRLHEGTQPNPADGLTFTIQTNSPTALGGAGGALGYQGIGNSVAIKFDVFNNEGETDNSTGLFFNGDFPGQPHAPGEVNIPLNANNVNLRSQSIKTITLTYNGIAHTLTEAIHDPTPGQVNNGDFTTTYNVDVASRLSADTAFVGFTGGTGGLFSLQDVLNWKYNEQEGALPPRAPTDLRITRLGGGDDSSSEGSTVTLAWNCNNAYTAQGFRLERSTDGTNFTPLATLGNDQTTFVDRGLARGTYYYRVKSFNAIGTSQISNIDSVLVTGEEQRVMIDHSAGFASHTDLTQNGATFSPDRIPVGTFLAHQDIGNVGQPGSATFDPGTGTYTVKASGNDIWDVADGFQFVYKTLTGNGSITARVTGTQFTDFFAKAGVMIRATLDANSPNALMLLFPQGQGQSHDNVEFGRRLVSGGCCFADGAGISVRPQWVRLVRTGNDFSAFRSDNGTTFFQVGPTVTINMSSTAFVGLAVTAHNNAALNTSTFDNVTITGDTTAPLPPTVARLTDGAFGEANTLYFKNRVDITNFTTSFNYQVQPRLGSADGLTFVIEGIGNTARGGGGGGLGYTGVGRSVAVKFDIWNLASHRSSTALYLDGETVDSAENRARSIFMDTDPANVINFNNGHVFKIDFAYRSSTKVLSETVKDTVTGATFQTSYNVDIPAHVDSNVGYVGFTGGTGGETAVQDVLTWTYKTGESDAGSSPSGVSDVATQAPLSDAALLGGGPRSPTQAPLSDAALLVGEPRNLSGFSLESAVPVANPTEKNDTGSIPLASRDSATPAKPISDGVSDPLATAHVKAVDQVFGSPDLFNEL
jgi:hypothetical protein